MLLAQWSHGRNANIPVFCAEILKKAPKEVLKQTNKNPAYPRIADPYLHSQLLSSDLDSSFFFCSTNLEATTLIIMG